MKKQIALFTFLTLSSIPAFAQDATTPATSDAAAAVKADKAKLAEDRKNGASSEQIAADKKALHHDRKARRHARGMKKQKDSSSESH